MTEKASADDFQVQDFVKKKKKKRKHKEHDNKTHENDESIQTAEPSRASPLLFEDRAAPSDEGCKKKKKKNKEKPQSLLDDSVPVELKHEINNETGENASPKKKKKKRKHNNSTGEQSDVACVTVNQHSAGVCQEVHADYIYVQRPVKEEREEKLPAEVEVCELPASERQDETDDKRLKKKKKKKKRSRSTQDTEEYTDVTVDQSLLSPPEQNRQEEDTELPLPEKKKRSKNTQDTQEYTDVTVDQSLLLSPEQNRQGEDTGLPLPKKKKKKKKRSKSTQDMQEYTDVTVDQSLLTSPEQNRQEEDTGLPLPEKKKRSRSAQDTEEYTDVTVDQSLLTSPEQNRQEEDTGLPLPEKKKRSRSTRDTQENTDVTVDQSLLSPPEQNRQGEDTGLPLPKKKKKKKKRSRSTQDMQEYTDVTVDQSLLLSPEQNRQGKDTELPLPKKKRNRSTQDTQEYTDVTVDQSLLSPPEQNRQEEDTGLPLPKKKKKRSRSTQDTHENTDVTVDQSLLSPPEQNRQEEDTGLQLPKEEDGVAAPQQRHEDGDCDASVMSEDSTNVPAKFSKSIKAADGSPKKPAVRARKVKKSSAIVTEDSSSESDVTTPEPSASKRKKDQNSSITEAAASDEVGMDDEDSLDHTTYLPANLDTVKQELEEFIPHVRNISDSSIRKMAGRDLARFKQFKKQGIAVKFGRFSQKENDQIRKNIEDFLSTTGIDTAEKLLFTSRYPEDKETIQRLKAEHLFCEKLSEGIPRPWRLIYYRARKMFDPNNYKGRYTNEEKEKLKKYHAMHGNDWKKISEMMSRSNLSVAMKYSEIKSANNYGPWSKEETRKLMHAVEEVIRKRMEAEDADSLSSSEKSSRDLLIDREKLYQKLPWTEIEAKVGTRYWRQCKQKWTTVLTNKMTKGQQLYRGTKGLQAKINLIKRLHEMKVEDANDVNWEELSNIIGNVPRAYVQAKFYKLKVSSVPLWQKKTFSEIIDYLFEEKLPELEEKLGKKERKQLSSDNSTAMEQRKTFRLSDIFDSSEESD